ncbi:MAG: NAD(P)-dependent alcohol dehydrogenase [Puniceicoccales bacterium]|nr:NAD(P)-dependent alcohol dehydrogenase [Puniceicoccales bacterium]
MTTTLKRQSLITVLALGIIGLSGCCATSTPPPAPVSAYAPFKALPAGERVKTRAYAVKDSTAPFAPREFTRRALADEDVLIEILYSGICHSDIHTANADWGTDPSHYPLTPGHEIVGRVAKVGKSVTKFKVGDIAAVGCMVDSCGSCGHCKAGEEQYCEKGMILTYDSVDKYGEVTQGGYSNNIVVKESFVLSIPSGVALEKVAPLVCAGVTTYSPLKSNKVGKGTKVGIAGFGGLGHMAVQYAVKMGAEVTVFDITDAKAEWAKKLGAVRYVNTKKGFPKDLAAKFDIILSTIPFHYDTTDYMKLLRVDGNFVIIGLPANSERPIVRIDGMWGRRRAYCSLIGGIRETQEALDFSIKNNIYPYVEVIPASQINDAYKKVLDGDVRFRFVIDGKSF